MQSLIHSSIQSSIHAFIHPLIRSFLHTALQYSFIPSFINSDLPLGYGSCTPSGAAQIGGSSARRATQAAALPLETLCFHSVSIAVIVVYVFLLAFPHAELVGCWSVAGGQLVDSWLANLGQLMCSWWAASWQLVGS